MRHIYIYVYETYTYTHTQIHTHTHTHTQRILTLHLWFLLTCCLILFRNSLVLTRQQYDCSIASHSKSVQHMHNVSWWHPPRYSVSLSRRPNEAVLSLCIFVFNCIIC
jgi:hypothetical protein